MTRSHTTNVSRTDRMGPPVSSSSGSRARQEAAWRTLSSDAMKCSETGLSGRCSRTISSKRVTVARGNRATRASTAVTVKTGGSSSEGSSLTRVSSPWGVAAQYALGGRFQRGEQDGRPHGLREPRGDFRLKRSAADRLLDVNVQRLRQVALKWPESTGDRRIPVSYIGIRVGLADIHIAHRHAETAGECEGHRGGIGGVDGKQVVAHGRFPS